MNEVQQWLSDKNRNYKEGVSVYLKYRTRKNFDAFFAQVEEPAPDSIHFTLLIKRMRDINRKLRSNPDRVKPEASKFSKSIEVKELTNKKKVEITPLRPLIVDNPMVDVKDLPEELQQKFFENKQYTKEMLGKHRDMCDIPEGDANDEKRKALANEITDIDDKRAANWKEIDDWWKANKQPKANSQKQITKEPTLAELATKRENLKNYIRREKAKIKKDPEKYAEGTEDRKNIDAKINGFTTELNELEGTNGNTGGDS